MTLTGCRQCIVEYFTIIVTHLLLFGAVCMGLAVLAWVSGGGWHSLAGQGMSFGGTIRFDEQEGCFSMACHAAHHLQRDSQICFQS